SSKSNKLFKRVCLMTSLITTTVQQIRVNRYHPLIKETYRGIAAPHYTSGTVTWPVVGNTTQPKGSQRARQTETESGPSQGESSTSHPVPDMTATIFKKPALPVQRDTYHSAKNDGQTSDPTTSASVPSIEELSAMVQEQAGRLEGKDGKIEGQTAKISR
ncbi:hypothetical protein TUN205_10002, partial [Pyrenophora tritici-repentis]